MQVIKYYQSENQAHWREEIGKGDWSAAELLHDRRSPARLSLVVKPTSRWFELS